MCNAIISPHDRQSRTASEYAVPPYIHINRHIDDKRKINPLSARVRTWRGHFWTRAPDRPVPVWSNSMYLTAASIAAPRARLPGSLSRATSHVPKFINSKLRANWWPRAHAANVGVGQKLRTSHHAYNHIYKYTSCKRIYGSRVKARAARFTRLLRCSPLYRSSASPKTTGHPRAYQGNCLRSCNLDLRENKKKQKLYNYS